MAELFEELRIGTMTVRNRMVRAATAESLCTRDGVPSKRMVDYYGELARGGVGTIITGYGYVCPDGKASERSMSLCDDAADDMLRALVDGVHQERIVDIANPFEESRPINLPYVDEFGNIKPVKKPKHARHAQPAAAPAPASAPAEEGTQAHIVAQLVYGGSKSKLAADDPRLLAADQPAAADGEEAAARPCVPNVDIVGPSAVEHPKTGLVPREATGNDILRIVKAFAQAAARAKRVGFDGVEIHAAHGYLLSQFLDGRFNQRTDQYGGSLENRARLALDVVRAVRAEVGEGYPVFVKLNSCDAGDDPLGEHGGMSEEESLQVAEWLVEAGASCIEVSGDWHGVETEDITGEPFFGSYGARLASRLAGKAPVIVTGGWRDQDTIQRYLDNTGIAGIGMGRPLICQTILPELWRSGSEHPAECTSCNWCVNKNGTPCILRRGK